MIKQRYVLKNNKYERCHDDDTMHSNHCPEKAQKLVTSKLNRLELALKCGDKTKKCVCTFLKRLGLLILALSAVAIFIRLGVVNGRRNPHHRRHHRGGRYHEQFDDDRDFQKFQQQNPDIKDFTKQDASEPINKGTMTGDQVFDLYEEMYQEKMKEEPKLEGYHLFYINCTTSNKNKTDYSWDQHCQLKDYNHPDWNRDNKDHMFSSSNESSEQPDEDFLQSQEEPVQGRRLEELNKEQQDLVESVSCRRRGGCRRRQRIAYIIDGHCFMLSRPQRHHRRHHRGHPGFCPYIALLRTIHILTAVWVLVFVLAVINCKCHKKRMLRFLRKMVKIENRDGTDVFMMLQRGYEVVEFHIKTQNDQPIQRMMPQQQAPSMTSQDQPNYYRVDLRQDRIQDESMVSRNDQSYRV